jgi:hypothetical protein
MDNFSGKSIHSKLKTRELLCSLTVWPFSQSEIPSISLDKLAINHVISQIIWKIGIVVLIALLPEHS